MKKLDTSSFLNVQNNMTYGLTLDNSWELRITNSELVTLLGLIAGGSSIYAGLVKLGLLSSIAALTAGVMLITFGVWSAFAALGAGAAIGFFIPTQTAYSRPTW